MKETNAGSQYSRETMEAMQDSGTGIVVATMMHCANVQIAAAPQEGAHNEARQMRFVQPV